MALPVEFTFSYKDLSRLTNLTPNSIWQHVRRGTLDPRNLESVLLWLSRHATFKLRQRMLYAALARELDVPKAKPRRRRK